MSRKSKDGLWQDEAGYWHIDVSLDCGRIKRATKTKDRKAAAAERDKLRTEMHAISRLGRRPRVTWDQATLGFLADCERRKLRSIPDYEDKFIWLSKRGRFGGALLTDIDKAKIVAVLKQKYDGDGKDERPVSGATVNRYYAAISSVLHFARGKDWLATVPVLSKDEKYPENDDRYRFLSYDEWDRMAPIERGSVTLRRVARFSLATGLRQHNAFWLEKANVDLKRRTAWAWGYQTKNKAAYQIPLNDMAVAELEAAWNDHPRYCFVYAPPADKHGRVWRPAAPIANPLNDPWYAWLRDAEVHDFRWHDFRHTWASWHVMNGTPLEVLQRLGGWRKFDMVLRYAHLSTSYVHTFAGNAIIRRQEAVCHAVA